MRRSLFGKMLGAHLTVTVVVFLTLFVAVSYLMEYYFHRAKEQELVGNATKLADNLARFPDLAGNVPAMAVIETFQQFTGTTVWVVRADGHIVKTTSEADEWIDEVTVALSPTDVDSDGPISHRRPHPDSGQPLLFVAVPVWRGEELVGMLYVHTPLIGVRTTIRGVRQLLISAGLISLAAATVVSFVTAGRIAAPLASMNRVVRSMAQGNWQGKVDVRSDDEVGRLGLAFNAMAERLAHTIQQLSQEKRKMEAVVRSMTDPVLFVDDAGVVRMTNSAATAVLTVDQAAAVGRPLVEVAAPHGVAALFKRVIATGEGAEDTISHRDPTTHRERTYVVHVASVSDEEGHTWGAVGLFHDQSEQAHLEKLRREFVADVSHELRTPLTSVRGFLEAIADGVPRDKREADEYLRIAIAETARLQRLADTLLNVSSVAAGGSVFDPMPLRMEKAVRKAVDRVSPQAGRRSIDIEVDVVPSLPLVSADPDQVDRILLNLLDNALHYSGGGRVTVSAEALDGFVEVSVHDDGPGIPLAEQPYVWERFYKVDKARRKAKGSGLGLVIVRQLVEMHGGRVGLESEPGEGARFYFTLPIHAEARTG